MFQQQLQNLATNLASQNLKVTCAESCTGGLLAANLTRLPGSSAWFDMGFVTYSNEAKQQLLNVNPTTLAHYGAVSEEVVREMALGALISSKADYALSISGIAGPSGGSEDKPVGLVWFGLASKKRIWAESKLFNGERDQIRAQAVQYAIQLLASKLD
ncbi:nicotinamide-nucleotide amidase [Vitreoscilla massiliensis]|uniref:Nicotinamide-nucleotide amidase n=1 Tax=Vitreoscilla massiliensis TaxID=1689272 RepID=A0ABY4DYF2_9NEIS|nr:nicotinamide-nucleotide amidase [Vitreoscilla massiliensis]UOO88337.1 nicotinamide-nucleotide amidase [Vitreoscilla massiliensis]